jgi:hypothetical protein
MTRREYSAISDRNRQTLRFVNDTVVENQWNDWEQIDIDIDIYKYLPRLLTKINDPCEYPRSSTILDQIFVNCRGCESECDAMWSHVLASIKWLVWIFGSRKIHIQDLIIMFTPIWAFINSNLTSNEASWNLHDEMLNPIVIQRQRPKCSGFGSWRRSCISWSIVSFSRSNQIVLLLCCRLENSITFLISVDDCSHSILFRSSVARYAPSATCFLLSILAHVALQCEFWRYSWDLAEKLSLWAANKSAREGGHTKTANGVEQDGKHFQT